jgi:hypothetical protein
MVVVDMGLDFTDRMMGLYGSGQSQIMIVEDEGLGGFLNKGDKYNDLGLTIFNSNYLLYEWVHAIARQDHEDDSLN